MMQYLKKTLCLLLVLITVVGFIPVRAEAARTGSGMCGDNLTWEVSSGGTLTISGNGSMYDYGYTDHAPWYSLRGYIYKIVINQGITGIGDYAFDNCANVTEIKIPWGISCLGENVFKDCWCLETVYIPAPLNNAPYSSDLFDGCNMLTDIYFDFNKATWEACGITAPSGVFVHYECYNASGHWQTGSVEPTCEVSGYNGQICPCGYRRNGEEIPALDHSYEKTVTAATCTEKGYTTYTCSNCGDIYQDNFVPATTHSYNATITAPTCTAEGYTTYTCSNCGDSYVDDPTPVGKHKTENGVCVNCGEVVIAITRQPENVTVTSYETVSVSVAATGEGLTYEWYCKDPGSNSFLMDASCNGDTYTVAMTQARNGRQVYCVIKDQNGNSVKTKVATLAVLQTAEITAQPQDAYGENGENITVCVEAVGDGLSYAWYEKDASASEYIQTSVATADYSVQMSPEVNGRQVYCVITDQYGNTVQSEAVQLNMRVSITKQPVDAFVKEGQQAEVEVEALGNGLTYQWYYKDTDDSKFSLSTSHKSNRYSVSMTEARSGHQVYCIITDQYENTIQTDTVTLKIMQTAAIKTQPKTTYVKQGVKAKVTVKAAGDDLTYQWYYKDTDDSKYTKATSTGSSYSVKMSSSVHNRKVYCVIKDRYGNSVKTDVVRLRMAATITTQPKDTGANKGSKAKVTVKAAGEDLTYKWYYKDTDDSKYTKSSFKGKSYSCTMTASNDGRKVYCIVTDKYGKTAKSDVVVLKTMNPAAIKTQPKTVYAKSGNTAKTSVKATGDGLTYQWYYKDTDDSKYTKSSSTGATYSCTMKKAVSGRKVYCVIQDEYGNSVKTKTVSLRMTLRITTQPKSAKVKENETATVTVKAQGDGVTYKWYYKNKNQSKYTLDKSQTDNSYTFKMTEARDGRKVYCVVKDKFGKTVKSKVVTMTAILDHKAGSSGKCTRCGKTMKLSDVFSEPIDSSAELKTFVPYYYRKYCYYIGNFRLLHNTVTDGVILSWGATNTGKQTIKSITFTIDYYDTYGNRARDSITGQTSKTMKMTPTVEPGKSFYLRELIAFGDEIAYGIITNVKIQYTDGGVVYGNYGQKTGLQPTQIDFAVNKCLIVEE